MVLWVFGYGSLVWNPGFDYDEKVIGFIEDYKRVFDLACIDHRGTPTHPARTCSLDRSEGAICWGAAFCVRGGIERERRMMEMERREGEYDKRTYVNFYKEGNPLKPALSRVIVLSNKYYLWLAPLEDMARQIATASGPCGNNREYLFQLEKAMHDTGHEDEYVIELANEVRKVLGATVKGVPKERKLPITSAAVKGIPKEKTLPKTSAYVALKSKTFRQHHQQLAASKTRKLNPKEPE